MSKSVGGWAAPWWRRMQPAIPFLLVLACWILFWQWKRPNLATLPSVLDVVHAFAERASDGRLWSDVAASCGRYFLGYTLGAVSGVALGMAAGFSRIAARLLEPLANFFTAVSGVVWIPLAIVWFGIGLGTVTFVIWNTVFFVVFATTLLGVRSSQEGLENAVRTLGGSRWDVLTHAVFPGSLPHVLSGLRTAAGFGWRALIAAEMIGASSGLGSMVFMAGEHYRTDVIILGVLVLAVLGLLFDWLIFEPLQRRTVERWGLMSGTEKT